MGKYPEIEAKMEKRIDGYAGELKTVRAGRANASVLDKIAIDYYACEEVEENMEEMKLQQI